MAVQFCAKFDDATTRHRLHLSEAKRENPDTESSSSTL